MSETNTSSVAYVRDTMLPQQPAPSSQTGVLKWMRENLFSGWLNTVLTLAGIGLVYWLFTHFYPWFAHSMWEPNSLKECREVVTAAYGEGATGACWGVIRERWHQFLFGFYDPALYWRPLLAFGLLLVVIGPILFSEKQRNRAIFMVFGMLFALISMALVGTSAATLALSAAIMAATGALIFRRFANAMLAAAIFPLVAIFLLWGGSAWTVMFIGLGFVVGWLLLSAFAKMGSIIAVVAAIVGAILFWLVSSGAFGTDSLFGGTSLIDAVAGALPLAIEPQGSDRFGGFLLAVTIGVGGIAMSLPMGVVLALGRQSNMFLIKSLSVIFIEFIRGVPLITLLFVASLLLNYFLPPGTQFDIILRVMILVTMFSAAYIAEVVRGGLAALPRGQYEAADALGLDYWRAQRLIILPQALKISIPGIVSTFIGMFKDTTLVVFVGLFDPLKGIPDFIRSVFEWKGIYWEPFVFVGIIFFIFNFSMSRYSMYLENRLKRDHR